MSKKRSIPLLLFAKAPIAGKVKTRLLTDCTASQAAEIAELLLEATLVNVCQYWPGDVWLSSSLDNEHPTLVKLRREFNVASHNQSDGDLGEKMHSAFSEVGYPAAILGADAPHVSKETLQRMHELLGSGQSVIGPSIDGGYYFIGLSQPMPFLFHSIPWGTSEVLQHTRERLEQFSTSLHEVDAINDIDEWEDLIDALPHLPKVKRYLIQQNLL